MATMTKVTVNIHISIVFEFLQVLIFSIHVYMSDLIFFYSKKRHIANNIAINELSL
jgi:hypothetical protein